MGQLCQLAIVHTKQLHVVQVEEVDVVFWDFQDSNNTCFAYLQIPKDGSEPHHWRKQVCHQASPKALHMHFHEQ